MSDNESRHVQKYYSQTIFWFIYTVNLELFINNLTKVFSKCAHFLLQCLELYNNLLLFRFTNTAKFLATESIQKTLTSGKTL
jgi:hypothetical protein